MVRRLLLILFLPLGCFAQVTIAGRVINAADEKPLPNASVFFSNATIGTKTANDGTFFLLNIQPGKYELVVSVVGFENYSQTLTVDRTGIKLPEIKLNPKTIALEAVTVQYRKDPDREKYLGWFKDEFLGTSEFAKDSKILNPDLIDLNYDGANHKLTASSADYLDIKNEALGYRIRYLVTDFSLENPNDNEKKISYKGPVQFEELKGTASQRNRWLKNRERIYENSPMHFLRAALDNKITEEGFRAQKQMQLRNPDRPSDSLISARLRYFKQAIKTGAHSASDSLSRWTKLSKLPAMRSATTTLTSKDLIAKADQPNMYVLKGDTAKLYVAYSKTHRYYVKNAPEYLYNANNDELTLLTFTSPPAFFYSNGVIINPYSVAYYGVWGKRRVGELLPIDYQPVSVNTADEKLINDLIAKTDTFCTTHPLEKVYLQFDKPFYAAGDTIYFKAYVTSAGRNRFSDLSGVLHVNLIRPDQKVQQSIKLHIDSGLTWGDFALPDSLPKGNYQISAYTLLTRTDSTLTPFNKSIPVGSMQAATVPEAALSNPQKDPAVKPDIQFFPEGGTLAFGLRSKVAFKALGADGYGIAVKGAIEDENGKIAAAFNSVHLGMGYFYLQPEPGKTYIAKATYANGEQATIKIPTAESKLTLSVYETGDDRINITLRANRDEFEKNKNKDYAIVIFSGGAFITLNYKLDKAEVTMDVEKSRLHTGVATVTLFSNAAEPLSERLLFVDNNDQLKLKISSNKSKFAKREKVKIGFTVNDNRNQPVNGHFSAAVINENLVPADTENDGNILTYFLLTSDLKGYVEQPGYYFSGNNATKKDDLDILMLTQGYRRFKWRDVPGNKKIAATLPEKGMEINGLINGLSGKAVSSGTVNLIDPAGGFLSTTTDEKGLFHFNNLVFADTAKFILSAVNAAGKNFTTLTCLPEVEPRIFIEKLDKARLPDSAMAVYITNAKKYVDNQPAYNKKGAIQLKEVKIREVKKDDHYNTQSFAGAGHADQVIHGKDLLGGPLSDALGGRLKGVTLVRSGTMVIPFISLSGMPGNATGPMLLIVDGLIVNTAKTPPDINVINAADVETIEVLKYASASAYGMNGANGVLIITTKQGGGLDPKNVKSRGVLPIKIAGFYTSREFYSPKYDIAASRTMHRDLRSTIYWQPEFTTDNKGNGALEFYNADGTGTYKVIIEGMDANGNIGRTVYKYTVR